MRDAVESDLPAIKELALLAWLNAYRGILPEADIVAENAKFYTHEFHGLLLDRTRAGLHLFKVLVKDDQVCGLMDFDYDGERTWLMRFYLLPDRIGKGLGKRLMHECERELALQGRRDYYLLVHARNTLGVAFYERNGFARAPDYDQPSEEELCYQKVLEASRLQARWEFPSREIRLENAAVALSAVDLASDLLPLFQAASLETNGEDLFRYHVNVPPMVDLPTFERYLAGKVGQSSEVVYKVFSKRLGRLVGCVSLMNVRPEHGCVEVGSIWYTKDAQRTEINTNVMDLLFSYVFEVLNYRRLEWKCHSQNEASRRAALRLGFEYEGLFRQHMVSRGENRDTAWYSMIDTEWSRKKAALRQKAG